MNSALFLLTCMHHVRPEGCPNDNEKLWGISESPHCLEWEQFQLERTVPSLSSANWKRRGKEKRTEELPVVDNFKAIYIDVTSFAVSWSLHKSVRHLLPSLTFQIQVRNGGSRQGFYSVKGETGFSLESTTPSTEHSIRVKTIFSGKRGGGYKESPFSKCFVVTTKEDPSLVPILLSFFFLC